MTESRVITGKVPPTGWHFIGYDGVRVDSWSLETLYDEVTRYRLENDIAVGNVMFDVDEFICKSFPSQCHPIPGEVLFAEVNLHPIETNPLTAMIDNASAWGRAFLRRDHPFELVTDPEAQRRSEICKACPMNVGYQGGCPDCVAALERIALKVRNGREVHDTKNLGICQCHEFEASAAAFMKTEELGQVRECAPAECWLRTPSNG